MNHLEAQKQCITLRRKLVGASPSTGSASRHTALQGGGLGYVNVRLSSAGGKSATF